MDSAVDALPVVSGFEELRVDDGAQLFCDGGAERQLRADAAADGRPGDDVGLAATSDSL